MRVLRTVVVVAEDGRAWARMETAPAESVPCPSFIHRRDATRVDCDGVKDHPGPHFNVAMMANWGGR